MIAPHAPSTWPAAVRPGQEDVIARLMAGQDAIALVPTGGVKSLCFQIPAICRPGTGLVTSPLVALMLDQVAALRRPSAASRTGRRWRRP